MLFSKPCCAKMESSLTHETRMFDLVGTEPDTVLMLAVGFASKEEAGKVLRMWAYEPVLFCPFCGTELQTAEAVEQWKLKHGMT